MATQISRQNSLYGFPGPLSNLFPAPLVLNRAPTTSDAAELGQVWVDTSSQTLYQLAGVTAGVYNWQFAPAAGATVLASLSVTPGNADIALGNFSVSTGTSTFAGAVTANSDLTVGGNVLITGTTGLTGALTTGDITVNGNMVITGDFDLSDTAAISITSTDNAPGAIALLVNGGAAETMTLTSAQGTGNGAIALLASAGGVSITGAKASANALNLVASNAAGGLTSTVGTGGYSFTATNGNSVFNTGTGSLGLSNDAAATTINIGTGAAVVKTISLGGTGANVIAIGNTQTGGSVTIGNAMTTGTIQIGSVAAQTGNFDLAPGIGVQAITLGNASGGAKTISIGNGTLGNQISIGNGINSVAQVIQIANGASAANTEVDILSGVGTAGAGTLKMANNTRVATIDLGNIAPAASRTTTIGGGTVVVAAVTDTINIGTGGATTNANSIKTVNVGTGALTLGENHVNIGTGAITSGTHDVSIQTGNAAAGTVTLNLSTGTGTKSISAGNADGLTTIGLKGVLNFNASQNSNTAINSGTSTGTVTIGNAAAGAISIDSGAASNFTTHGAGVDLTLSSVLGSVVISATEVAADSIQLTTAATGGITVNASSAALICHRAVNVDAAAGVNAFTSTSLTTGVAGIFTSSAATVDAIRTVGGGISVATVSSAAGASPRTVSARHGQAIFTDVIANGAYGTLTVTNTIVTVNSLILANVSCTTVNSALQIVEITPAAGSFALRIYNAGAAATAANILVNFWAFSS